MIRRILGDDIERDLWPLLTSLFFHSFGQFAFFAFFALYALEALDARATHVGFAFSVSALAAVAGGVAGGRLSDRFGRRAVVTAAAVGQALLPLVLVAQAPPPAAFATLVAMGFLQPFRGVSQRALLADLVRADRRVQAYGAYRVVQNTGGALGPVCAAVLVAVDWRAWALSLAVVYACSVLPALRLPDPRPAEAPPPPPVHRALRDRRFLLVFGGGLFGFATYHGWDMLLPVALTQSHGWSPSAWGPLFAMNAVAVVALQMRVTRWTARFPMRTSLVAAMLLMGMPLLALELGVSVPLVVAVLLVVVVGEMLWMPNAEALVVRLAPAGLRGVYLGAVGSSAWAGAALAPAAGLWIRDRLGDGAMWTAVALAGLTAAALYWLAAGRPDELGAAGFEPATSRV